MWASSSPDECSRHWQRGDPESSEVEQLVRHTYAGSDGGPIDGAGTMQTVPRLQACRSQDPRSNGCVDSEGFHRDFVQQRQPVLIRGLGALSGWPASSEWAKGEVLSRYGKDLKLRVSTGTGFPILAGGSAIQPIKTLRQIFDSYLGDHRLFVFDNDPERTKQFAADLPTPSWLAERCRGSHPIISLGGKCSGLPWHMHGETWFASLAGRKRWFLYPPGGATNTARGPALYSTLGWVQKVLPQLTAGQRPLTFLQEPGDLLYLPSSWAHATINLDEVLGYGQQMIFKEADKDYEAWARCVGSGQGGALDPDFCHVLGIWLSRVPDLLKGGPASDVGTPLQLFNRAIEADPLFIPARLAACRYFENRHRSGFSQLRSAAAAVSRAEFDLIDDPACDNLVLALVWSTLGQYMWRFARTEEEKEIAEIVASKILPLVQGDRAALEILGVREV